MEFLPKPEVKRCYFDDRSRPPMSAMELSWHPDGPGLAERTWHLPQGLRIHGAAPTRFGIAIERTGSDAYNVRVLWDQVTVCWQALTRVQIMTSSLSIILQALGSDMWHMLHQPVDEAAVGQRQAA
ncbi:MAG: hypothetical protein NZO58_02095 [Gemmataceae bacterium]|nr:hypothetical protein [Gemmataceae bacterium]